MFQQTIKQITAPSGIRISQREQEVLYLIAYEHNTREIADKLFISYDTALTHRKNLLRKLMVKNVAGMVRVAIKLGFIA